MTAFWCIYLYEVQDLKYSVNSYKTILNNLHDSLIKYFVEILQEDIKEANFWFEWINKVVKSESDEFICFQVSSDEEIRGFITINLINLKFALIRHFFIIDTVKREEVSYILLKEAFESLKYKYKINEINNAAFTFPEDYLLKPLKRLGFNTLKRYNMTLNLANFDKGYKLPSGNSFVVFNKENLPEVAKLCVQVYKNHPDGTFWDEVSTIPFYLEHLETIWTSYLLKECSFMVKNARDQIFGFCLIEKAEDEVMIQNIAINKQDQGKGIGKALLSKGLEATYEKGYKKAILTVTEGNYAQKMYDSFGFKKYTSFNIITDGKL